MTFYWLFQVVNQKARKAIDDVCVILNKIHLSLLTIFLSIGTKYDTGWKDWLFHRGQLSKLKGGWRQPLDVSVATG